MFKKTTNPRLIDAFDLPFTQEEVDFAVPHLKEDIPLYLDPFLMWSSDNEKYHQLHTKLISFFETIRIMVTQHKAAEAMRLLSKCGEVRELGLGYSLGSKRGNAIGRKLIGDILSAYDAVPQLLNSGFKHIEELQLIVPGIAEDRISDITSSILKDYFIEFTTQKAKELKIPVRTFLIDNIYDDVRKIWKSAGRVVLPFNPLDESPILFAPLDFLRHLPWINYEDYYRSGFAPHVLGPDRTKQKISKPAVLKYNKENYVAVERYVQEKELLADSCKPAPIFTKTSLPSLRKRFTLLRRLGTGIEGGNDRKYEELIYDMLSSLMYPSLEFAENRVRTASGAHIRDLIFYNDGKTEFLRDIRNRYDARQPVFELKNVQSLDTEHVNQLYRYLDEEFGRFGVLVTRNPTRTAILRNIVDLHSSKRFVILCLDDGDIELMINLAEAERDPIDVLKKKYVEFTRLLPK